MFYLLSLLAVATGLVKDCNVTSIFRPTELGLTPDPPVVGQPVHLTVRFDNPGPAITDGTVITSVTLNFIPFSPTREPLCTNTACPLVSGPNDRSTVSTWPSGINGNLVTKSVWNSVEGDNLLCIQTSVKTMHGRLRLRSDGKDLFRDDVSLKQVANWMNYSFGE